MYGLTGKRTYPETLGDPGSPRDTVFIIAMKTGRKMNSKIKRRCEVIITVLTKLSVVHIHLFVNTV